MRPRIFPSSQQQLASACEALSRRVQTRAEPPSPKDRGPLIAVVFFLLVTVMLMGYSWNQMIKRAVPVDYLVAQPAPTPPPIHLIDTPIEHEGILWHVGEVRMVRLPLSDAWVEARYIGETTDGRVPAGIKLGDMIKYQKAFWVWLLPAASTTPRWVDP